MSENVAVVCNITGVTPDQAATLLEMSNGSVEAAIGLFFETGVPENKGIDNIPHINKQIDEEEIAEEEELMKEKKTKHSTYCAPWRECRRRRIHEKSN